MTGSALCRPKGQPLCHVSQRMCDSAGRIEISAQNHNYAVDPSTLPEGVQVTHINLNNGACAGMVWADKRALAIQYHPEASPGPHDSDVCFEQSMDMIRKDKQADGSYTSSEAVTSILPSAQRILDG